MTKKTKKSKIHKALMEEINAKLDAFLEIEESILDDNKDENDNKKLEIEKDDIN